MVKDITTRVAHLEQIFGGVDGVQTPEATVTALTNSMNDKTTNGILEALSGTYTKAEIEQNLSELNEKIDAIVTALENIGLIA